MIAVSSNPYPTAHELSARAISGFCPTPNSVHNRALYSIGSKSHFFVDCRRAFLNSKLEGANADLGDEFCVTAENDIGRKIALGDAHYSSDEDQLYGADGTQIFLRAQSAQVLRYMTQRLGVLVSREELIEDVWRNLSVTDDSLTQCIADVRRAIGDKNRDILKTIPKRGFVLNGEAIEPPSSSPARAVESAQPAAREHPSDEVVVYVRDPAGTAKTDIRELLSGGKAQSIETPQGPVKKLLFSGVDAALDACAPMARRHGIAMAIAAVGVRPGALLDAARPGEVLATVDIRDLAQTHPRLSFEDLGQLSDQAGTRAFRLLQDGDALPLVPHFQYQPLLPTISVLPLQNIDQDSPDVLGSVFADVVTAALGGSEEINVISRLSTAAFDRRNANLSEIGQLLNAEFVLSGFFVRRGDKLQLNLEFAEVATQRMLWAFRLEVPVDALLGDFDAVHEIVAKVRRAILINEIRRANSKPLATLKNYSLMFAAVGLMHRLSPNDFRKARDLLDVLTERVPKHPVPLAWTARWHLLRVVQGWSDDPDADTRRALNCTGRALDLDPENVLALACEGHVLTNLLHRFDEAEDRYNLALQTNPNDVNARSLRGMLLAFQDRGEEGVQDTERALHLAPLDPHRFFYLAMAAGAWLTPGGYEKAEEYAKASLRLNRTHTSTLRMLVVAQQKSGKIEAARETVSELMRLQPGLRVKTWLKSSPSAEFRTGRVFAQALLDAGVPE